MKTSYKSLFAAVFSTVTAALPAFAQQASNVKITEVYPPDLYFSSSAGPRPCFMFRANNGFTYAVPKANTHHYIETKQIVITAKVLSSNVDIWITTATVCGYPEVASIGLK